MGFLEGDPMSSIACAVLVVAKAPVAGQAKTRLAPYFGPEGAADLAAAALLDTLTAVRSSQVTSRIVALTGDVSRSRRGDEISSMLVDFTVIPQNGAGFAERLVAAHIDAAALSGSPVLQIGMDTPQISPELLSESAGALTEEENDAVLGPATDGGWWALGLSDPAMAVCLGDIAMSRSDTGDMTVAALQRQGSVVVALPALTDVDSPDDVWAVAKGLDARSHFRHAADQYRHAQWRPA